MNVDSKMEGRGVGGTSWGRVMELVAGMSGMVGDVKWILFAGEETHCTSGG